MVKSIASVCVALMLLVSAALFEWFYVEKQFNAFGKELETLALKVDEESANAEDAEAVQISWEKRKKRLYVWIPHGDLARIDEAMAESVRLIGEKQYSLALSKLEVIIHLASCLPGTYRPTAENIL